MESQKLSDFLAGAKKNHLDGESSPEEWFDKGFELFKANRYEDAIPWIEKAIKADYTPAYTFLGILYHDGLGVPQNLERAFELFRESASHKDCSPIGMFYVGQSYIRGEGVEQDIDEGLKWLDLAEENCDESMKELIANARKESESQRRKDLSPEDYVKITLDNSVKKNEAPELPTPRRIKRSAPPFIFKTLLFLIGVAAVVLVRRMDVCAHQRGGGHGASPRGDRCPP